MFEEWWIHEVMVESPLGLAGDGSRTLIWGNRRVVKCHVRAGQRKVLGADGEVVMATSINWPSLRRRWVMRCSTLEPALMRFKISCCSSGLSAGSSRLML